MSNPRLSKPWQPRLQRPCNKTAAVQSRAQPGICAGELDNHVHAFGACASALLRKLVNKMCKLPCAGRRKLAKKTFLRNHLRVTPFHYGENKLKIRRVIRPKNVARLHDASPGIASSRACTLKAASSIKEASSPSNTCATSYEIYSVVCGPVGRPQD